MKNQKNKADLEFIVILLVIFIVVILLSFSNSYAGLKGADAAIPTIIKTEHPCKNMITNSKATIDYSNMADGYVMCQYVEKTDKRIKVMVAGPTTSYTYNLSGNDWSAFPLSDGNGKYTIKVYKNVSGTKYGLVLSETLDVKLKDEFAPFLLPNQYVNYEKSTKIAQLSKDVTNGSSTEQDKILAIYNYVINNYTYDKEKAKTVQSGYLPDIDKIIESKKGICFDYAALMTSLLRVNNIPCKLVVGYAGSQYHAWISIYTQKEGWINGAIYFDGKNWKRVDPTFLSTGKSSKEVIKFVNEDKNYSEKYFY